MPKESRMIETRIVQMKAQLQTAGMFIALCGITMGIAGCGGPGGPARYQVSGKVTFGGKPVPYGTIFFTPDTSKGNKGPQGVAQIKDGKYDTAVDGKGPVGGPVVVKIIGYETLSTDEENPSKPLFQDWTTNVDIPENASTQDFEVPADAAEQKESQKKDVEA